MGAGDGSEGHAPFAHFYLPKLAGAVPPDAVRDALAESGEVVLVKKLLLAQRDFTDVDAARLAEAVLRSLHDHGSDHCSTRALEEIALGPNDALTGAGVANLCAALCACAAAGACGQLKKMDLTGLPVLQDDATVASLIDFLEAAPALCNLIVGPLDENAAQVAVDAADRIAARAELNRFPPLIKRAAIAASKNDPCVKQIDLSAALSDLRTRFTRECSVAAVGALSRVLVANTTIQVADLSNLGFSDAGAEALADVLRSNTSLIVVKLMNNAIAAAGGRALVRALRDAGRSSQVAELHLQDNDLCDIVAEDLLSLLRTGETSVGLVELKGNCVSPNLYAKLFEALVLNTQPAKLRALVPQLQNSNSSFTRVTVDSGLALTDTSARVLMQALRCNTVVTHIDVSNNAIGDEGAIHLAQIVEHVHSLRRLIAQFNQIGEVGAQRLLEAVPVNPRLETLDLKHQTPPLASNTLDALELLTSLTQQPRELFCNGLRLLRNDPSLTTVHLGAFDGKRHCSNESVSLLVQLLRNNTNVRQVFLCNNEGHVSPLVIPLICTELCPRLTLLDLSNCRFFDEDLVLQVNSMLTACHSMQTLLLEKNRLTSDAAKTFARTLRGRNHSLTKLSLVGNPEVRPEVQQELDFYCDLNKHSLSFKNIVLAIESNQTQTLKEVRLCDVAPTVKGSTSNTFKREFDDLSAKLLCTALSQNDSVTTLNMSGNRITDVGVDYFAAMMRNNTTLTHVDLSYNAITDAGLRSIARALTENHSIKVFVFKGNGKDPQVAQQLNSALLTNVATTVSVYSAAQTRHASAGSLLQRDTQLRQAQVDAVIDAAIFNDAMVDFNAVHKQRSKAQSL